MISCYICTKCFNSCTYIIYSSLIRLIKPFVNIKENKYNNNFTHFSLHQIPTQIWTPLTHHAQQHQPHPSQVKVILTSSLHLPTAIHRHSLLMYQYLKPLNSPRNTIITITCSNLLFLHLPYHLQFQRHLQMITMSLYHCHSSNGPRTPNPDSAAIYAESSSSVCPACQPIALFTQTSNPISAQNVTRAFYGNPTSRNTI